MVLDNGGTISLNQQQPQPGMGKWNRSKRRLKLQQQQSEKGQDDNNNTRKTKITKQERREKYTAIAKERQMKQQQKDLICFRCRQRGHSIQYCTNEVAVVVGETSTEDVDVETKMSKKNSKKKVKAGDSIKVCCYKCGSTDHNLASYPEIENAKISKKNFSKTQQQQSVVPNVLGSLPYATCFICQQQGHIASQCTQNTHGIYVNGNGGQCNYCQSVYHRGSQCPENKKRKRKKGNDDDNNERLDDTHFDVTELFDNKNDNTPTQKNLEKANDKINIVKDKQIKKHRVVKF